MREALGSYEEDPLLEEWIDEVLDALGPTLACVYRQERPN